MFHFKTIKFNVFVEIADSLTMSTNQVTSHSMGCAVYSVLKKMIEFIIVLLFVASCAKQANSPLGTGVSSLGIDEVSPIYKDEPFAYDAVVDTISYNSCYGENLASSGIHGFVVSAVENPATDGETPKSGVRITKKYLDFIGTKINPSYPATTISTEQVRSFIAGSPLNKNVVPIVAVRRTQSLDILPEDLTSTNLQSNKDYYSALSVLTNINFITSLIEGIIYTPESKVLSQGPRINDFKYADDSIRTLNVKMGYNLTAGSAELYSWQLRNEFNRKNLALALTFHDNEAADFAINPLSPDATNLKRAYGRSFQLGFNSLAVVSHNSIPANLLTQVEEKDLDSGSLVAGTKWSCRQYMVMRSVDQNVAEAVTAPVPSAPLGLPLTYDVLTNTHTYYLNENGQPMTGLEIVRDIRRQYSASEWDIVRLNKETESGTTDPDTDLLFALVPKLSACYGAAANVTSTDPDPGVDYTPWSGLDDFIAPQTYPATQGCFQESFASQGISYGSDAPKKRCANWVSVCTRTSVSY